MENRRSVHLSLIVVQVLFGLWPVAGQLAMRTMSPAALVGVRTLLGAPILIATALALGAKRPRWGDLLPLAGLGFLGISLNQILYASGLKRAGAVNAVVLTALIPVITLVVGMALGRESLPRSRRVGIFVALVGVLILVGAERFDPDEDRFVGNAMILANTISYSTYLVLARPTIARLGPLAAIAWIFLFGAIEALPLTGPALAQVGWSAISVSGWLSLGFIVIGPTVGTYFLNAYALRFAPSSLVATYVGLQPLVGAVAAASILGEPLSLRTAVAGISIVAGVIWACH